MKVLVCILGRISVSIIFCRCLFSANLRVKISERLHVAANRQNFTNWSMKSYDDRVRIT
jgi:hypothetical protein